MTRLTDEQLKRLDMEARHDVCVEAWELSALLAEVRESRAHIAALEEQIEDARMSSRAMEE